MFRTYLKTGWRNLIRNKAFSVINITGLALGITCSLLILFWVEDEKSVDQFPVNKNRLYTVYEREYAEGEVGATYATPGLLAEEIKKTIPGVRLASSYSEDWNVFRVGDKVLKQQGAYASEDFLTMFSFPLSGSQLKNALGSPTGIAISKKMAREFFGDIGSAMGKTMRYGADQDFLVTAVFDDAPVNSSLRFDYLLNWSFFLDRHAWARTWSSQGVRTYLQLAENTDPSLLAGKLVKFLDGYYTNQGPGLRKELGIQRFDEQYLYSHFKNGFVSGGRIQYVRLFSVVAVFILLIACINFMNLTTARSVKRAKEIGVRKVVGALRRALIVQFIMEAMLLVFLSMIIAVFLANMLLPLFNKVTGKHIGFPGTNPLFWVKLLVIGMVTGFIAGCYPALYLSSLKTIKILKGSLPFNKGSVSFQKGLVIFQFILSILLITGTIVVSKQINYIQTTNLGYNRENLVSIDLEGELAKQYETFRQQALTRPGIKQVTQMTGSTTMIGNYQDSVTWEGMPANYRPTFAIGTVGYDFTKTMGIDLVEGRDFSVNFPGDSSSFLINESAAVKVGYKNPIGRPLTLENGKRGFIIGVTKDFHIASLHEMIDPMILDLGKKDWGSILVKMDASRTQEVLTDLEKICRQLNPAFPFTYQFAEESYRNLYRSEQVIGTLSKCFAFLAIIISCFGLLGLALTTVERRTKEIGIRKVLGANAMQLFGLLSKEFLALVAVAMVIAIPLAWLAMSKWLEEYAYRTDISWWVFLVAGALALATALATVSFQAIKVALLNPVKSLKAE